MCGIAGFQGAIGSSLLKRMSAAIAHRGPDDQGEWVSSGGEAGLAHRRLSILDVSPAGRQPMLDATGTAVIAFNGEIYNFRTLRRQLEKDGYPFRSHSDTEVLVALYRRHGEAMLPMLDGIFAFAVYDLADRSLLLAVDGSGIKPLYVAAIANAVLFASELKALVRSGLLSGEVDVRVLCRMLGFIWSPGGDTPLRGVRRLSPGEALRVTNGRIARRWRWAPVAWRAEDRFSGDADAGVVAVRDALRTAVHRQMVSDVPVGAFLSGGLDSSAVVAMAREVSPSIECFTIASRGDLDAGTVDDLPYARRVARHLGVRLHEVPVDAASMAADLEAMVAQLDEPLADPAALNVRYISRLAKRHGFKVLLSGTGGDDLFTGYRRHAALAGERYWAWLPQSARTLLRKGAQRIGVSSAPGRRFAKLFAHADADPFDRMVGYFLWTGPERALSLLAPEHRARLSVEDLFAPFHEHAATLPSDLEPMHRMLALEQRFFLADHNLLYTDKMSMGEGVEVRVPFLDRDLVRLANGLPVRLKRRGGKDKWVLRKSVAGVLPQDVLSRPKTGFGAPVRRWVRRDLTDLVDDLLSPATVRARGLFDPHAVGQLVADDRAGRIDAAYTVLGLVCMELWCRTFLEGGRTAAVAGPVLDPRVLAS